MKEITKNQALELFIEHDLIEAFFYKPANKSDKTNPLKKVLLRKILLKQKEFYQFEIFKNNQVFHKNTDKENLQFEIKEFFDNFKQIEIITSQKQFLLLKNKKGIIRMQEKENLIEKNCYEKMLLAHDNKKNYALDIEPIPEFLKVLKLFTQDGKLIKNMSHKFKQINKYLEFIASVLPQLKKLKAKKEKLQIVDFGCGKAYLSFALYFYLNEIKKIPAQIIGLDLKTEVIDFCNCLAKDCNFTDLKFIQGDINSFNFSFKPDMIISLHACDIATDMALAKAVKIEAPIIFAVPCCQHEINKQIRKNLSSQKSRIKSLFDYGIITEKFASLLTDTIRAKVLEKEGYKVSVEEFIDLEHTPKNILIKAIKTNQKEKIEKAKKELEVLKAEFLLDLSIEKFLSIG